MSADDCLRTGLLDCIDDVLGVREDLCAQIADVYLITRTWSGEEPGDGTFTDTQTKLSPLPEIVDYSHDVRVSQAGAVKSGDLILRSISKNKWTENDLRTDTGVENIEKFLKVGDHYYRTIHIKENFVTWDVHIRKVFQDESERS